MKEVFFYGLRDPLLPDIIRYVGMTDQVVLREQHHRSVPRTGASKSIRIAWLHALRAVGRCPEFVILQSLKVPNKVHRERTRPSSSLAATELQWIRQVQESGRACLNREALSSQRKTMGVKIKTHYEYLHACIHATLNKDRAALRRAVELERLYPDIFHVFRIGNLNEHIRIEEWPKEKYVAPPPVKWVKFERLL